MKIYILLLLTLLSCSNESVTYKTVGSTKLKIYIYQPKENNGNSVILFYGGGWIRKNIDNLNPYIDYFKNSGFTCYVPEYRVSSLHKTTPFDALKDAVESVRYIKDNYDTGNITMFGMSAGGHLASACNFIGYKTQSDNLIMISPVIDNSPSGYGYKRIGHKYKSFSPLHNIGGTSPNTLILTGDNDDIAKLESIQEYKRKIDSIGGFCDIRVYKGEKHGFHIRNTNSIKMELDSFFHKIGLI